MKRRFDIRRYTSVAVVVTLVMYLLSTFVFSRGEISFATVAIGLLLFAANAAVVYVTADFFSLGINHIAPLVFAILALSFPAVALYDPSYLCTVPLNAAFYICVRFYGGDANNDMAFLYSVLLGVASLMFPPLLWVAVFMLIMNFWMAGDKLRFIVISIVGFLLPLVVALSAVYVSGDIRTLMPAMSEYLRDIVMPYPGLAASSAARVIKILILLVCFAVALVAFFRRNAEYSVSHSHAMILVYSYSALITLIVLVFSYNNLTMNTILIMVPVSVVLYDYLVWGASDKACRIALAFTALAVVLEYAFFGVK
ncbi:MAG: hypothetical protein J5801_01885 [Bacteroidales bacterium]|nr:hypothetical protein [Bacteroidales bacterium]